MESEYLRFKSYFEKLGIKFPAEDKLDKESKFHAIANTLGDATEQCRIFERLYQIAVTKDRDYAENLRSLWVTGQDSTENLLSVIGRVNPIPHTNPVPLGDTRIWTIPGPPFMAGLIRIINGQLVLIAGTYRPVKLFLWCNGAWIEQVIEGLPSNTESIYMLHDCPDGHPIFSTEWPAGVGKHIEGIRWRWMQLRSEPDSVAFEFHKVSGGLSLFTVNRAWGDSVRLYRADANGNGWTGGRDITGKRLINATSDGETKYLIGSAKDGGGQDFPIICDVNGNEIARRPNFDDQTANYSLLDKSGLMSVGMNAVDMEDKYHGKYSKRNAYLDLYDTRTKVWRTIKDLTRPFIFDMVQDGEDGPRAAVETSWKERDYKTSLVWVSNDKGLSWGDKPRYEVHMRTVNSIQYANNGLFAFGGTFGGDGEEGFAAVDFFKR